MKKDHEFYHMEDFVKMLYLDSNIPCYLYLDEQLQLAIPTTEEFTLLPSSFREILSMNEDTISYYLTDYGVSFACVKITARKGWRLFFGPVSPVPLSESELHHLYSDYVVPVDSRKAFLDFIGKIPQLSLAPLLQKLIFINYCLNREIRSLSEFLFHNTQEYAADSTIIEESYERKEDFQHNRSYELENMILNLIRTGNADGFQALTANEAFFHTGITSSTALQQLRNNVIISTTLCTRAAIDGGLDYDTAYQLSDNFIRSLEQLQKPEAIYALLSQIGRTFAAKVAEAQTPHSAIDIFQNAIRYIQQNTNLHLTVQDVADYVGFSRSYFSTAFKKELGFSISDFILRCKLEEGKRLLRYTDKSISLISSYLCFSSQSHFQTAFKKQFGMTPLQCRKSAPSDA